MGEPRNTSEVVLFVGGEHADHVAALRRAGYCVELAATALAALTRDPPLHPDALVVPLILPDMHGADLARKLEGVTDRARTLAVVALATVKVSRESTGPAIAAGATLCPFPCDPDELVATVARQLAARRRSSGH